ncbi:MAG: quinolinate synthase NadA [bacterium]
MDSDELNIFKYAEQLEKIPEQYAQLTDKQIEEQIEELKQQLGDKLVLLGHNYQAEEVLAFCEHSGDSYKLAKVAASMEGTPYIVFCGVTFMAESADILTGDDQQVIIPALEAACPMAGMAELVQVEQAWEELSKHFDPENITPITYMNSYADLKGFCGEHGGAVCTSSNASTLFDWALENEQRVFFFPDEHLGRNSALELGLTEDDLAAWNPWAEETGGLTDRELSTARVILWAGNCQVHQRFSPEDVRNIREQDPDVKVIVHPECRHSVVEMADEAGSTGQIIETITNAATGTSWAIGTESNLIIHLQKEHPEKNIYHLGDPERNTCLGMAQITPAHVLWMLEEIKAGTPKNVINVDKEVSQQARRALDKMIELTEGK